MLTRARNANLALALIIEIAMLAAFAAWPFTLSLDLWLRIAIAVVLVAAGVAIWSRWAAPRSATRLAWPGLVILKLVLFALATAALWNGGRPVLAGVFALAAILNLGLAAAWRQL